jgi:hypothetical protein
VIDHVSTVILYNLSLSINMQFDLSLNKGKRSLDNGNLDNLDNVSPNKYEKKA